MKEEEGEEEVGVAETDPDAVTLSARREASALALPSVWYLKEYFSAAIKTVARHTNHWSSASEE